jgi:hypothetical protein
MAANECRSERDMIYVPPYILFPGPICLYAVIALAMTAREKGGRS